MAVVPGHRVGGEIAEALGLPLRTIWFELRCAVDEITTIKCAYFPDDVDIRNATPLFAKYEVCNRVPTDHDGKPITINANELIDLESIT